MRGIGDGKRLGHARNVAVIPFVMGERSENMEGVGSEGGGWSGSSQKGFIFCIIFLMFF